jgi:hypothetical protein
MDWRFPLNYAGLPSLTSWSSMLLDNVNPFNYQSFILGIGKTHLASFASIPTGNN